MTQHSQLCLQALTLSLDQYMAVNPNYYQSNPGDVWIFAPLITDLCATMSKEYKTY